MQKGWWGSVTTYSNFVILFPCTVILYEPYYDPAMDTPLPTVSLTVCHHGLAEVQAIGT